MKARKLGRHGFETLELVSSCQSKTAGNLEMGSMNDVLSSHSKTIIFRRESTPFLTDRLSPRFSFADSYAVLDFFWHLCCTGPLLALVATGDCCAEALNEKHAGAMERLAFIEKASLGSAVYPQTNGRWTRGRQSCSIFPSLKLAEV